MRYDPKFWEIDEPKRDLILLKNACGVMVHEIGHMFGIKHCIFFNCIMNGSNTYQESTRKARYLCPVCIRKLSSEIGFSVQEWITKMHTVNQRLGFDTSFYA